MSILLQILIEMVGYTVARFALPFFSSGRIYVEPLGAPSGKFSLIGYRHDERGRIEIESTAAGVIGLAMCLIVAFGLVLLIRGGLSTCAFAIRDEETQDAHVFASPCYHSARSARQ
jgi:hypothetical protein